MARCRQQLKCKVHKERLVPKEQLALKGQPVPKEQLVLEGQLALKVQSGPKDLLAQRLSVCVSAM